MDALPLYVFTQICCSKYRPTNKQLFLPSAQWKIWLPHVPMPQSAGKSCRLVWVFLVVLFFYGTKIAFQKKCFRNRGVVIVCDSLCLLQEGSKDE